MMPDLVQWLRAQLDEDERIALDAGGDRWSHHGGSLMWPTERGPRDAVVTYNGSAVGCIAITNPVHGDGAPEAVHIAEHDPARVLREIDARRRTLIRCEEEMLSGIPRLVHFAKQTVREMALPYEDRPGYAEAAASYE
jgi:hypothetical protein